MTLRIVEFGPRLQRQSFGCAALRLGSRCFARASGAARANLAMTLHDRR
jgi:hypothetical protein